MESWNKESAKKKAFWVRRVYEKISVNKKNVRTKEKWSKLKRSKKRSSVECWVTKQITRIFRWTKARNWRQRSLGYHKIKNLIIRCSKRSLTIQGGKRTGSVSYIVLKLSFPTTYSISFVKLKFRGRGVGTASWSIDRLIAPEKEKVALKESKTEKGSTWKVEKRSRTEEKARTGIKTSPVEINRIVAEKNQALTV